MTGSQTPGAYRGGTVPDPLRLPSIRPEELVPDSGADRLRLAIFRALLAMLALLLFAGQEKGFVFVGYLSLPFILLGRTDRRLFAIALLPGIAIISGLVFSGGKQAYDVFKDIYYLSFPVFALLFGVAFADTMPRGRLLRIIVLVGSLLSLRHILAVLLRFDGPVDLQEIRSQVGAGSPFTMLALVILICALSRTYGFPLFARREHLWFALALNLSAFLADFSRTLWISFVVMLLVLFHRSIGRRLFASLAVVSVAGVVIWFLVFRAPGSMAAAKLLNSFTEIFATDFADPRNIHINYRAFEALQAMLMIRDADLARRTLGLGLGTQIDLGQYVQLSGGLRRYIPILHNGYAYLFVKSGAVGFASILVAWFAILRFCLRSPDRRRGGFSAMFAVAIACFIFIANLVVSALYNPGFILPAFILGAFLGYASMPEDASGARGRTPRAGVP